MVGEVAKVLRCIILKPKTVVAAALAGLEVGQQRVDPLQLGHILGLTPCHDCAFMGAAGPRQSAEARQAIGIDGAASGQAVVGPVCNSFDLEARYRA